MTDIVTPATDEAALAAAATADAAKAAEAAKVEAAAKLEGNIPDPEADKKAAEEAAKAEAAKAVEAPAPTGDVGLDIALAFFAKAGIGKENESLKHAASTGDFARLEAELAALNVPGWQQHVALAKQAEERVKTAAANTKAEAKATILKAVGGAENWTAIRDWAAANATPEERKSINDALAAGGFQAKSAAEYLATRYAKAGNKDPKEALKPGAKPTPAQDGSALTPRAYAAAVEALAKKVGSFKIDGHPEYKALQQRRQAWKPS